jgi:hypothetical protein
MNYIFNELDIISELIITYKFQFLKSDCKNNFANSYVK